MAAEEPSIVAGCCLVCTRIVEEFTASSSNEQGNIVIAQLLLESPDDDKTCFQQETFNSRIRPSLIETCNGQLLTGLRARGARGVVDLVMHTKTGDRLAWLNIHVDVGDINGANTVTRLAEQLAPFVEQSLPGCRCLVKICSNLCAPQRTATAEFRVPVERLATGDLSGAEVCRRIVEANRWASIDPYRAVTHNKGIMNGVDAVAVATGQDWRSIEAACHAYACGAHNPSYQQYRALTDYWVDEENAAGNSKRRFLCARLTLPLAVAAAGGACRSNDSYRYSMGLMDFPDSCQLAQIMTCIGLACNLAALRALVTEGLITGHMKCK
jgi:hydroxymethylglutaryl-CoA reductase